MFGMHAKPTKQEILRFREAIGAQIRTLRQQQNPPMTQFDLAVASGERPESISRIERGTVDYGVGRLLRIARALRVPVVSLIPATWDI